MWVNPRILISLFWGAIVSGITADIQPNNTHFEIIIPTYNNEKYCIANLRSAIHQKYDNFHITVINDCSTDATGILLENFVHKYNLSKKVIIIHNATRQGALANFYKTIYTLDDNSVVVSLDGDDRLANFRVLSKLNDIYTNYNVWLTYGQFRSWPSGDVGWCTPMPENIIKQSKFREFTHMPSHLRTFRVWLFKKINVNDLMYEGTFFPMTADQAMMFPMIEMAGERHAFIRNVLYTYNEQTSLNDHKINGSLQGNLARLIRSKEKYKRLFSAPVHLVSSDKPLYRSVTSTTNSTLPSKGNFPCI